MNPYETSAAPLAPTKRLSLFSLGYRLALVWYLVYTMLVFLGIISLAKDKSLYDMLYIADMLVSTFRIAYLFRHTRSRWLLLAVAVEWIYYGFVLAYLLGVATTPPRFPFLAIPWIGFALTLPTGKPRRVGLIVYASLMVISTILNVVLMYRADSLALGLARELIRMVTTLLVFFWFITYDFEAHLKRTSFSAEASHT